MNDQDWEQLGSMSQKKADDDKLAKKRFDLSEAEERRARIAAENELFEKINLRAETMKAEAQGIASKYNRNIKDSALKINVLPTSGKRNFTVQLGPGPVRVMFEFEGDEQLEISRSQVPELRAGGMTVYKIVDGADLTFLDGKVEVHPAQMIHDACMFVISAQAGV